MKNPDAIYAFNFPYTQPQVTGTGCGWTKKNMEQKIKQKNQSQN